MSVINRRSIMTGSCGSVQQQLHSRVSHMSISGKHDSREVMLLEDNYMDGNELAGADGIGDERSSRPRKSHRKHNVFARLEV